MSKKNTKKKVYNIKTGEVANVEPVDANEYLKWEDDWTSDPNNEKYKKKLKEIADKKKKEQKGK